MLHSDRLEKVSRYVWELYLRSESIEQHLNLIRHFGRERCDGLAFCVDVSPASSEEDRLLRPTWGFSDDAQYFKSVSSTEYFQNPRNFGYSNILRGGLGLDCIQNPVETSFFSP